MQKKTIYGNKKCYELYPEGNLCAFTNVRTNFTELGSICENGTIMRNTLEEQKMQLFMS